MKLICSIAFLLLATLSDAQEMVVYGGTIKVTNTAPSPDGVRITPVWAGIHDGQFDTYDGGVAAFPGIEALAEDGMTGPLSVEFLATEGAVWDTSIGSAPLAPGEMAEVPFVITAQVGTPLFFSYASMILPSNDKWVSNGNPEQYEIVDANGAFVDAEINVVGADVLDAGTEVNDEVAENVPLLGQETPNTGEDENGVVTTASGFIEDGPILTAFPDADFTVEGYSVMRIEVTVNRPKKIYGRVRVTNLAPSSGTFLTPVWAAIHDGTFDTYNRGEAVRETVERLAEDGTTGPLIEEFAGSEGGLWDGTVGMAPVGPGAMVELPFEINIMAGKDYYFSYASMVIPSNDLWIANGNPEAYLVIDEEGNFIGQDIVVMGSEVLDAGTEINDESTETTAFFGQSEPDTGVDEEGVVTGATGYILDGPILSSEMFSAADFTAEGYQVARIEIFQDLPKTVTGTIKVRNMAPESGTYITPVWTGVHDGTFDIYSTGFEASPSLESLAEDGSSAMITEDFLAHEGHVWYGSVGEAPLAPGSMATRRFEFTYIPGHGSLYFSYASMILPSNDAFVGNAFTKRHRIVSPGGEFISQAISVSGLMVRDAGTEVNDEIPAHVPFLGQEAPNTGVDEGGVIRRHEGFIPADDEESSILSDPDFANADFTMSDYKVMEIVVSLDVPVTVTAKVIITNLAPVSGTFQTPVWVGVHDGSFDLYNRDEPLPAFLEPLAEDGNTGPVAEAFAMAEGTVWDGVVSEGPIAPGATEVLQFDLTYTPGTPSYFSYASMIIPSNDAWIGNGNPMAYEIVDASGNFLGTDFMVLGTQVLDAGTEVNDEIPANTAFLEQAAPNTGEDENGVVTLHPGFIEGGTILSNPMFANGDFLAPGYQMMSVKVIALADAPGADNSLNDGTRFLRGRK